MTITLNEREYDVIRSLINIRIRDEVMRSIRLTSKGDESGYTDEIREKLDASEHLKTELNELDNKFIRAYNLENGEIAW